MEELQRNLLQAIMYVFCFRMRAMLTHLKPQLLERIFQGPLDPLKVKIMTWLMFISIHRQNVFNYSEYTIQVVICFPTLMKSMEMEMWEKHLAKGQFFNIF